MTVPSDAAVLEQVQKIKEANSGLGMPKVLKQLKDQHHWQLSLDRLRKIASSQGLVNTTQHYVIKPTEDKGLGAFATRDLAPGTVVISEPPIVVTNEMSVNAAYDSLDEGDKRLFMSFTKSPSAATKTSSPTASAAELVFQNNAYTWDASDARELAGLFPTLPRFNHACSPNLTYQSDFEQGRGSFVAIVPIKAGEELCTAYCERTAPRVARQKRLRRTYGFECKCGTCTLPQEEQRASDVRRVACQWLDKEAGPQLPPQERFRLLHLRLALLEQERLMGPDRARSLYDCVQVSMHAVEEDEADAGQRNPERLEKRRASFKDYARLAAAEFARGGNKAEAERLQEMVGERQIPSEETAKDIWKRLDAPEELGYACEEERWAWQGAKLKEAERHLSTLKAAS